MGAQVGLGRHWFHRDHYDIPQGKRVVIEDNALLVSPKTIVRLIRNFNNPARTLRMEMPESTTENHDHEDLLLKHYIDNGKTGVHLCPNWHYMAIHDKSPEFEACQCTLPGLTVPT